MKRVILSTALIITSFIALAQPTTKDIAYRSTDDLIISVVECQSDCEVESGVYHLTDDGYSKITSLERVDADSPSATMAANSKKVLDVLSLVGVGQLRVKYYEEFWISDCAKQSVYTLIDEGDQSQVASSRH